METDMTREEAIKELRGFIGQLTEGCQEAIKVLIPELAESEDEKIRKRLVEYFKGFYDRFSSRNNVNVHWEGLEVKKVIAYLEKQKTSEESIRYVKENHSPDEVSDFQAAMNIAVAKAYDKGVQDTFEKQKEQKPVEWSEKDRNMLNSILLYFNAPFHDMDDIEKNMFIWLQSLPERFNLESKQEWSNTDNIGWDEAFACVTSAEKAAKNEEELQNAITAEKWLKKIKFKYCVHPVKQEWSEGGGMETINVFRPLAGTSIESAAKQAVNKFTNSDKKFLLAFNGVFILINNTKSVQDIVSEYNRSLGGKKEEQGQSEREPNDFEITLNDCMLAAQQYPPGKIGWDDVKMWAEELSNYCPQPKQEWDEFDDDCLKRAIWYVENPAPSVVKDTNLTLWLKALPERFNLEPKQEWSEQDIQYYDAVMDMITNARYLPCRPRDEIVEWFKSLKNRGNFLKRNSNSSSWSEEDENKISALLGMLTVMRQLNSKAIIIGTHSKEDREKRFNEIENWLKFLRPPQYCENCKLKRSVENWKPSEEQMRALNYAYCELFKREDVGHNILGPLQNLIDTLRKL